MNLNDTNNTFTPYDHCGGADVDNTLKKADIKWFLGTLRRDFHAVYVLIANLPSYRFNICRYTDYRKTIQSGELHLSSDRYSVQEFHQHIASFHRADEFRILFADKPLYFIPELTLHNFAALYDQFIAEYCEKSLRANESPLRLTREVIHQYALTRADVKEVRARLDKHYTAAREKLQSEYEALRSLRCIRR